MASCQTPQWANAAPYVKLTVTQSSSTDTSATLSWTLEYIASSAAQTSVNKSYSVKIAGTEVKSGTYDINGKTGTYTIASGTKTITKTTSSQSISFSVSFAFNLTWINTYGGTKTASGSISVAAKTSYSIKYNANGGSGAPSTQTKWYGTNLTLSSTKPTRTGYTFQGWATSSGGSVAYASGATYSANASVTLYAVWKAITYEVKYNANGGSGAPSTQTKTYGVNLTLSSTKPTRTNYTFKGWGTSASATTVSYSAGGSYTKNAAITLYAIWELSYIKPRIKNLSVSRCDSSGNETEEGTNALVSFNWECDKDVSSIVIEYKTESTDATTVNVTSSGTSGSVRVVIGSDSLITDSTYSIKVIVTDSGGYTYAFGTLNGTRFAIDILSGGLGVAIGKPAELENIFDIGFKTRFYGGILPIDVPDGTDFDTLMTPNVYNCNNAANAGYLNIPITSKSFTLYVNRAGTSGSQTHQKIVTCTKYEPEVWERFYYSDSWGEWLRTSDFKGTLLWSGGYHMVASHTINLSEKVSQQPNGIILVFSRYSSSTVRDYHFNHFFVHKTFVEMHPGAGSSFIMSSAGDFNPIASKYLYISDDRITGHDVNNTTGTGSSSGIAYENDGYVLRYVIGV